MGMIDPKIVQIALLFLSVAGSYFLVMRIRALRGIDIWWRMSWVHTKATRWYLFLLALLGIFLSLAAKLTWELFIPDWLTGQWVEEHPGLAAWVQTIGVIAAVFMPTIYSVQARHEKSMGARRAAKVAMRKAAEVYDAAEQLISDSQKARKEIQSGVFAAKLRAVLFDLKKFPDFDFQDIIDYASLVEVREGLSVIEALVVRLEGAGEHFGTVLADVKPHVSQICIGVKILVRTWENPE